MKLNNYLRTVHRTLWRLYYGGEIVDWYKWYFRYRDPVIDARTVRATVPRSDYPTFHSAEGHMEQHLIHDFLRFVEPDDVFWDVGANVGLWTLLVGQKAKHTVAFEPDERVRPSLTKNIRYNRDVIGLPLDVDVRGHALGDEAGTFTMTTNDNWGIHEIDSRTVRADWYIDVEGYDTPDVVKIDVEGYEGPVLAGFGDHIGDVRRFLIEIHPRMMRKMSSPWSPERIVDLLEQTHDVETVYDRANQHHIEAVR